MYDRSSLVRLCVAPQPSYSGVAWNIRRGRAAECGSDIGGVELGHGPERVLVTHGNTRRALPPCTAVAAHVIPVCSDMKDRRFVEGAAAASALPIRCEGHAAAKGDPTQRGRER